MTVPHVDIVWQPRLHCGLHHHRHRDEEDLAIFVLMHRCLRIREGIEDDDENESAICVLVHRCLPSREGIEGAEDVVELTCAW